MKRWSKFLPMMMAAVLMTACAGKGADTSSGQDAKQDATVQSESKTEGTESSKAEDTKKESAKGSGKLTLEEIQKRVTEKTYPNHDPDACYVIDFVEYPDWGTVGGRVERVEDGVYLGAGNLYTGDSDMEELYKIKDRMEIPEGMAERISDLFFEAEFYAGYELKLLRWQDTEYTSIEDVGEFNGYEWCRFEGDVVYDYRLSEEPLRFHMVGYTTFLKNSGMPMYVAAMDTSEDQSHGDQLDELAKNSAMTLYEVDPEDMKHLKYID